MKLREVIMQIKSKIPPHKDEIVMKLKLNMFQYSL